jgi:glycosyltransferase involved in cell wall biosynthesis
VPERFRCDVVLEQTLGHVTHSQNLERLLPQIDGFDPTFVRVAFPVEGWAGKVPGYGNWTVRAGLRARRGIAAARRRSEERPDAMFVHTQVPAVLCGHAMRSVPTVVSLDATPRQYDLLGEHYAHTVGPPPLERLKAGLHRRCFDRAAHMVTWAEWTRRSLADDYGVDPARVTVIPPGVDTQRWLPERAVAGTSGTAGGDGVVRILFVGGDLRRKGGDQLLRVFAAMRAEHGDRVELHLVTTTKVDQPVGVTVHAAMTPNSPALIELYHRCDIFCLPTLGDCLPMVLPEAAAAGLALVSTDVGAIGEIVRDEQTGLLVGVGDEHALASALHRLIGDDALRRRLARAATELVVAEHDAGTNARRLVATIRRAAEEAE